MGVVDFMKNLFKKEEKVNEIDLKSEAIMEILKVEENLKAKRDELNNDFFNVNMGEVGNIRTFEDEFLSKRNELEINSIIRLGKILRIYLEQKYGLKQNLTFEELAKEIKNKNFESSLEKQIMFFLAEVNDIEYSMGKTNTKIVFFFIKKLREIFSNVSL